MRFTAIILALLLSAPTMAHQLKASVTTVLFNKRTNNIELMHRFYLHDTEHAVEHLFDGNADILSNKEDQKRFADYVESHIALQTLGGKPLELKDVGAQVDGKFFWVYQEVTIPEGIHGIRMSNGALRDLWPAQVNMVNIEGKGKVKTLTFSQDDTWLEARFESVNPE
ncbi:MULTISPECIES: DUF6702 family protein [Pseudoalteromonas]|jgi:hypothetical protein|uniref:DUF6702 family protein n=1 Tax=Pseudoalteromonas TaxID=53246 RepID=UPI0007814D6D|nr:MULTISPECIES: DUF6702 family protein [Pseudoalteromonas]KZY45652.1 hypothetical protein A3733_13185 [Pseudoalteromonas shioyasakiensis]KZY55330.1 hypothetical protein A3733_28730 [Pseudoalteromonas shioyasakiensis]MCO7205553.1 hypothetical protein [Pseudoalteromonas sp. CnMc7-37]MCZ4252361.1 hypothetical protein [Pseudoalteromonas shioyasakiensis]NRA79224.1 hypothetical protein [Pseudoalteromonas sp.]|tara:strand:+ start:234 stop:737 length:504 start_codon:yes stop_codon:yes gene_type:complete